MWTRIANKMQAKKDALRAPVFRRLSHVFDARISLSRYSRRFLHTRRLYHALDGLATLPVKCAHPLKCEISQKGFTNAFLRNIL